MQDPPPRQMRGDKKKRQEARERQWKASPSSDGVVAGVILISAVLAFSRGFVRETMSIAAWVAAAVVAFMFAPDVVPLINEVPYLGDFIGTSCEPGHPSPPSPPFSSWRSW